MGKLTPCHRRAVRPQRPRRGAGRLHPALRLPARHQLRRRLYRTGLPHRGRRNDPPALRGALQRGAQAATINPTVTGYDIGDYITEFSLEIHSGKQVSTYNTLYGLDNYLMMLDGKKLGDYTDVPFRCGQSGSSCCRCWNCCKPFPARTRASLSQC